MAVARGIAHFYPEGVCGDWSPKEETVGLMIAVFGFPALSVAPTQLFPSSCERGIASTTSRLLEGLELSFHPFLGGQITQNRTQQPVALGTGTARRHRSRE